MKLKKKLISFIIKEIKSVLKEENLTSADVPGDIPIKTLKPDELTNVIKTSIPGNTKVDKILQKFPSLKKVILDMFTEVYNDYIQDIFVIAPKPTTFKVVLKNSQDFFLTYTEKTYVAQISGKKYYLTNIQEQQRALQALVNILNIGIPAPSLGPGDETPAVDKEEKPKKGNTKKSPPEEI